ncbi:hypothetical protein ACSV5K_25510, partial [Agrobacterium pusense]|uniref:hypothetical protein n=1 Tax=Agrobacterium pusense TaxID=648995 RepID=UPI003FD520B1
MKAFVAAIILVALCGCTIHDENASSDFQTFPLAVANEDATLADANGCRSKSIVYPWGPAQIRLWTPSLALKQLLPSNNPGAAVGRPFRARLVRAYGVDTRLSSRVVELELKDGCRRRFLLKSFSSTDIEFVEKNGLGRDLPLKFHPAAIRASAVFDKPNGVVG